MRLISWNVNGRPEPWHELARDESVDVALLQEAKPPPDGVDLEVVSGNDWRVVGWEERPFCSVVARCSSRYRVGAEPSIAPLGEASSEQLAVSRPGTLAVASVSGEDLIAPVTVVSAYAPWERPVPYDPQGWIYADASAHRLISDLSGLISRQRGHRIVVAGDWNILHGYGEGGSPYWEARYRTVKRPSSTVVKPHSSYRVRMSASSRATLLASSLVASMYSGDAADAVRCSPS